MILLCDNMKIRLRLDNSEKNSMLLVGGSRMGKTYLASNLAEMLIRQGKSVHLIDLGNKWSINDKARLQSAGADTRLIESQGISLLFHSSKELTGCAKVIANAIGFQSVNASITLKKIFHNLCVKMNDVISLKDVLDALLNETEDDKSSKEWATKVYDYMETYGDMPNIEFRINENKEFSNSSMIWELTGLDDEYVKIISSLIVYCLLCQQKRYFSKISKSKNVFIIIDEFQNLNCSKRSIIGTCLTEGQKYRLSMILITQFISGNFSDAVITQFKQGGFRFYFRLTEEEASTVSRQIVPDYRQRKELYKNLISLKVGNCLLIGPHSVGERNEITEAVRFVKIKGEENKNSYNRGKVIIRRK